MQSHSCTHIDLTSIYTYKWAFEKSWKNVWLLPSYILSYPNFEVIGQSCNAMPREKPQANFLLCCWTFPEMGSLLNHLRKNHEPDADTCQQEPRNTIAGCWNSQTTNLQRRAVLVRPAARTTMLTKFPLYNDFAEVRWLPHWALLVKLQRSGKCGVAIS